MKEINTEDFLIELIEIDPNYQNEIQFLEEKYNCEISCDIEKHNDLQYTYFYDVDFGCIEKFFVEIESGINNGTQLNSEEWGVSTKETTKTINVLKDFILDMDFYEKGSFTAKKAQEVLDANKSKLFEYHRQNNYDNYVTGGNSKMELDHLLSQLHLENVYDEIEVDCNFSKIYGL